MVSVPRHGRAASAIGLLAVAATVALGVLVRLQEPLSNPVIPAEDPFTHMARVKMHLHAGGFEALGPFDEELYPPGMHAALAATWAFAGGELYSIFRFAPVAFGGVSVLGVALLLWRQAGRIAAVVGGLGVALAPELVFRTTMMAPTAVDVAVLPFLFYAFLEVLAGRLAWIPVASAFTLFLVFTHPWLLGMLAAAGLVFTLLALGLPWPLTRHRRLSGPGFAAALAIVGVGSGLVLSTCGGYCGPGYQKVLQFDDALMLAAPVILLASLLPAVALVLRPKALERLDAVGPRSWIVRALVGVGLAAVAVGLAVIATRQGLPEFVDPVRMIGWPLLGLAGFALLSLGFLASPLSYLATGLAAATYPLALFPLLGGAVVSHRIVVYLGLAAALLSGVAVQGVARWIHDGFDHSFGSRSSVLRGSVVGLAAALVVAVAAGGAVASETPEPYREGWYRLYEPCEMDALRDIAERIGTHPDTILVTGDWRPNTVLSAIADPAPRVWFSESFLVSETERRGLGMELETSDGSLYFLEERHLHTEKPDLDLSFLNDGWTQIGAWCGDLGQRYQLRLHVMDRTR